MQRMDGISRRDSIALLCLGPALGAGAAARAQGKPLVWDLTVYLGPTHEITRLYQAFAADVKTRTNGQLEIRVRPGGELPFSPTETVSVVGRGQVMMGQGYMGFISGSSKIAALPSLPFLVRTAADLEKAMPILAPYVDKDLRKQGAMLLFWDPTPWPHNFFGRGQPMQRLEDLRGRKVRGTSPEQSDLIVKYGGIPVTLTTAEVPEAMQRGVVDVVITASANIVAAKWEDMLQWGYVFNPHVTTAYVMVNEKAYNALAAPLQAALKDAGRQFQTSTMKALVESDRAALQKLSAKMKIMEAPPSDVARYQSALVGYWDEWAKKAGPDAQEALSRIRKELNR